MNKKCKLGVWAIIGILTGFGIFVVLHQVHQRKAIKEQ